MVNRFVQILNECKSPGYNSNDAGRFLPLYNQGAMHSLKRLALIVIVTRGLKVFGLCIGAALICAFAFVVMLRFSLPPADGAYGLSTTELLSDPFVLFGALYGGAVCGVLSFPFAYLGTLHRRLLTSALFVFAVVITEIMLVTPFAGWGGLVCAIPALGFGLLVCQYSGWKWFA